MGSGVGGDGEFFSNGHAVSTKMVAMPIYSKMLKKFFPEPRKLRGWTLVYLPDFSNDPWLTFYGKVKFGSPYICIGKIFKRFFFFQNVLHLEWMLKLTIYDWSSKIFLLQIFYPLGGIYPRGLHWDCEVFQICPNEDYRLTFLLHLCKRV